MNQSRKQVWQIAGFGLVLALMLFGAYRAFVNRAFDSVVSQEWRDPFDQWRYEILDSACWAAHSEGDFGSAARLANAAMDARWPPSRMPDLPTTPADVLMSFDLPRPDLIMISYKHEATRPIGWRWVLTYVL